MSRPTPACLRAPDRSAMAPSVYANMDATEQRLTLQWLKDGMKPTKVRRASEASHAHVRVCLVTRVRVCLVTPCRICCVADIGQWHMLRWCPLGRHVL